MTIYVQIHRLSRFTLFRNHLFCKSKFVFFLATEKYSKILFSKLQFHAGLAVFMRASVRYFYTVISPLKQQQSITANYRKLREHYDVPKYPIVLCHGFSGFDKLTLLAKPDLAIGEAVSSAKDAMKDDKQKAEDAKRLLFELEYWAGIKEALQKLGSTVFIAKVPAFGDIESRARSLDRFITKQCKILRESESKSTIYTDDRHKEHETFKEEGKPIKINLISHSMGA